LGLESPDDAAVYRISEDKALVQTVDFFTPVVDDAYQWGAIAVANALSDIYAMGGTPLMGLNLVGWPKELDMSVLAEVLEGGADKAQEAGAAVVGGHTVDDPEPKFGMAVTGIVHPDKIVRQSTARAGMSIVLTKPLGMGIISTAVKREQAPKGLESLAAGLMSTLNRGAAEAMQEVGVGAATDVTGFGLMGHLNAMARSSGVGAEIWPEEVPIVDGVEALAERDLVPGGTRRNEDYYGQYVDLADSLRPALKDILFDAQTSGGLLIAVDEAKQDKLIAALKRNGTPAHAVIGRIVAGEPGRIKIGKE